MNQKMTVLSEHNIAFLKGENKTPQQISVVLHICCRNFAIKT